MPIEQPGKGPDGGPADFLRQLVMAMDLPFVLIGALVGGGALGYFLDEWLHTTPALMLVLGFVGFAAGLRTVLQTLNRRGKT